MARKLQDRLALASYRTQNGLDGQSFDLVEAHFDNILKRKRPGSMGGISSDSSSTSNEPRLFSSTLGSSPITGPMYSDDLNRSGNTYRRGRGGTQHFSFTEHEPTAKNRKKLRTQSTALPPYEHYREGWKTANHLPESSPLYHHTRPPFPTSQRPNTSFVSEISTVPDSPPFGHVSDEEVDEESRHSRSFHPTMRGSPPRTPPPTRNRAIRQRKTDGTGEEGADLLLYLATSPSPANPNAKTSRIFAPSTPPSKVNALPSSMMSTPGGGFLGGFGTPGQQFNFADFVNVTPSPAQGAFGSRTPGLAKTPLAAKEARRRLNFEGLAPPSASPNLSNLARGAINKENGLGMELGGELVS